MSSEMTAATAPIPSPQIVDGVVAIDIPTRTLAVRVSELEQAGGRRLWREAFDALKASQESGWRTGPPTLWASAPGASQVAHAVPGDFGMLLFRFPTGEASFAALIGKPGLTARVGLDRSTSHFINVRFLHADP
jgi:hypothetical protein